MTDLEADLILLALWFIAGACCASLVPDLLEFIVSWRGNHRIGNARSRAASREARRRRELGLD